MFPIKGETTILNSKMTWPSSSVLLFLTIEFLIGTFLSVFLAVLIVIKSLLPKPPRDLANDVVLVAGASSSLGEFLREEFAKNGCYVVCVDNNSKLIRKRTSQLKEEISSTERTDKITNYAEMDSSQSGSAINVYECNLLDKDDIRRTAEKVKKDIGRVDVLITCADDSERDIFDATSKTLMSHFWTVLAFLPLMLYRKRAHVVGVTPVASNSDAYHGSRAAVTSLMESLRQELCNHSNHLTFLMFSPIIKCSTMKQSDEQVAKNIVRAVKTDQNSLNINWVHRLLYKISCMMYNGITLLTQWIYPTGCDYSA